MNTSSTQWFAVATTAHAMAAGIKNAATFIRGDRATRYHVIATSRFHPKCRLGIAAYLLTNAGGCNMRYEYERSVTVSTNSGL
jgi:hypothetical protein